MVNDLYFRFENDNKMKCNYSYSRQKRIGKLKNTAPYIN